MKRLETVKNEVEQYRRRLGMTQEELALEAAVTRQTIISIEKGNYVPSVLLALKLAGIFKLPVEEVFQYEPSQ